MKKTSAPNKAEVFDKPKTFEMMAGPVKVNYKHVYVGQAAPIELGGIEVVIFAKDKLSLAEIFLRLGFGDCAFEKAHEVIIGPRFATTGAK